MKRLDLIIVAVALLMALMPFGAAAPGGYTISQLTDNEYDDLFPQIDDGQVVWRGYDGNDYEIFLWDGTQTIQLTDNEYDDYWPQIDNGQVVWRGYDGNDCEIFLWDGTQTIQLTNNNYPDNGPQIDDGQVVWQRYWSDHGFYDWEIFLWDGTQTIQLTNNDYPYHDSAPQIDAGQVAWIGYDGNYWQIFLWDGTDIIQLSYDEYNDYWPQIDNGQVAWHSYDGFDYETFLWDGTKTIQLSYDEYDDYRPQIDDGQVVWHGYTPYDYEIFLWDGSLHQLTDNGYLDTDPQIDAGMVVWKTGSSDIMLWDGTDTIQLTDSVSTRYYLQIDAGQVVWVGYDGHDFEIFLAVPPYFPLAIQFNQVQIFPHGAEKVMIEGEFILDMSSDGIDPAADGFSLRLSLDSEESSQFYPDSSDDFMPVMLQETGEGWTITQSEKDKTGIQDLEIRMTSDPNIFIFKLVDTKTGLSTDLDYRSIVVDIFSGNDAGSFSVTLTENNGKYTL